MKQEVLACRFCHAFSKMPPEHSKHTWGVLTLIKGLSCLETSFIRKKTQPVRLKLHPGAGIASRISCVNWIMVDGL